MANSELYGTYLSLKGISKQINELNQQLNGKSDVLSHIISSNDKPEYSISYSYAKKLKNFFENHNTQDQEYDLKGGSLIKNFINTSLDSNRNMIHRTKQVKANDGRENQFIKTHEKSYLKPTKMSNLKPGKGIEKINLTEIEILKEEEDKKRYASVIIIVNDNKDFLVVKRRPGCKWGADQYALVGGKQEPNEDKYDAAIREIKEETNLDLSNIIYLFSKKEEPFDVNVFFAVAKNPDEIELNSEHTDYKWVKASDLTELDLVPNLIEDVADGLKILSDTKI